MARCTVANIAVEQTAFHFDRLYSYTVDASMDTVRRGCRVLVPFGGGNRCRQGIVVSLEETDINETALKSVAAVLDEKPLLNDELLELALWLKERTFCTVFDAVRAMLPTGLCMNTRPVYQPATLTFEQQQALSPDELSLYRLAQTFTEKHPDGVAGDKLLRAAGLSSDSKLPERMVKKGWLLRSEDAFRRAYDATRRMARLTASSDEWGEKAAQYRCSAKQKAVLELLEQAGTASVKELCYLAGVTDAVIRTLEKKGLITCFEQEVLRSPSGHVSQDSELPPRLNEEQQRVFQDLLQQYRQPTAACSLLYGVTGSGKTQVYMHLIDTVIAEEKQALVLVPEISLTPQTTALFLKRYGRRVAVLHSGLSVGERMDEWKRIRRGDVDIVVGTRSAVFAPLDRLGLIVMDEEQEHTYKSENNPRYHAREVAKFRCVRHNALLLLASATPSVESYYAAKSGRYSLHTLMHRYGESVLPTVEVADMRLQDDETSVFSETLKTALAECLQQKKQAILLLNRRGYQTFVSCRSCEQVITCPSCSISMTYHRANHRLLCHYCGHSQPAVYRCPTCGSDKIRYSGIGTQRIEEELERLFPSVKILRMDMDTTMSRFAHEQRFREFAEGDYQIMIGTQMVAKGLDFPNVALVGVLSADQSLYAGDYRSYETAFSLLTQVIGRAGRRETAGKAIIQTTTPEHYVIDLASKQDYPAFYEVEIAARKMMKYPPFADLCMFGFVGTDERAVRDSAHRFVEQIRETVLQPEYSALPLIVLDPTPASVARASGKYRYKLLMKLPAGTRSRAFISTLLTAYPQDPGNKGVTVFADLNPSTML